MSLDEFEREYSARSGLTVAQLHAFGLYAVQCNCGEGYCQGWQMVYAPTNNSATDAETKMAMRP